MPIKHHIAKILLVRLENLKKEYNPVRDLKNGFIAVFFVCLVIFLAFYNELLPVYKTWAGQTTQVKWSYLAELLKVIAPLIAGVVMLWQGYNGKLLATVKQYVRIMGIGILLIGVGAYIEFHSRAFLNINPPAFNLATILFVIGAILVAWSLFEYPNRLGASMSKIQGVIFVSILSIVVAGTIIIMITSETGTPLDILSQCAYVLLILVVFAGALRCVIVFLEGRIGRPFLLIAIGSLSVAVYIYYVWLPYVVNMSVYNYMNILWIGAFLITTLGAMDMSLSGVDEL